MSKIKEAQKILLQLGLPKAQQNEMAALTLLALCQVTPKTAWHEATRVSLGVSPNPRRESPAKQMGIMGFFEKVYKHAYAPNTRETVRRQVLHQLTQAQIVDYNPDNPALPVNSPRAHYAISPIALATIRTYQTSQWEKASAAFKQAVGDLNSKYQKVNKNWVSIQVDDIDMNLSPGKHNEVQAAVINEFKPRFAKDSRVLYIGDTAKKDLYVKEDEIRELHIPVDNHSKLPDIILYDSVKKWLFLVEVVTSHGPVSPKRFFELEKLFSSCSAGKIYVTAFPDQHEFKKHAAEIAWETEVWIMESPDHLIHFNGDRFMGPR